jgi:signal transduction histidine kinase
MRPAMLARSLSTRLLLISLGWCVFALLATGLTLVSAFRESVERRFDDTLGIYLSLLIGQLSEVGDIKAADVAPELGEPRFVLPLSGWYWAVVDAKTGETVQSSESLAGDVIPMPRELEFTVPGALYQTYGEGPTGDALRLVARRVSFDEDDWYVAMVSGAAATIEEDTANFTRRLAIYLTIFAAVLLAVTYVQWRLGLRPLKRFGNELRAIQEGRARHVSTKQPAEIAPLAQALNGLIDSNQATLDRSRQHVGNLAHALKTPLSVLLNDAANEQTPLGRSVREQVQVMQRQVRYYLERARMAAKDRVTGTVTDVIPSLQRLHRAMARLGERRGIVVHLDAECPVKFAGEQQDLEEIVGNLLDNALKFARSEVVIDLKPLDAPGSPRCFSITVDDDGPGLSEEQRTTVLSRGKRLDESKPGSGLGLSIVSELVELYGGTLRLERAPQGGLRVRTDLPRA